MYPDSAPPNWREILEEMHIEAVISPLHEFDTDPNGEVKKAHWHVLLSFEGKKSYEQIKEITDSLNAPIPQKCQSAKGMVRYFLHLDNPDKYQYSRTDMIAIGGADIAELLKPTSANRDALICEMCDWVDDNEVMHFAVLARYARAHRRDDWHPLLTSNSTVYMKEYIKSIWQMTAGGTRDA